MAFQYPQHPRSDYHNPFQDGDGKNPFADEAPAPATSDNPYAASARATDTVQPADAYEPIYAHRGGLILRGGAAGAASSLLGTLGFVAGLIGLLPWILVPLSAALVLLGAVACSAASWLGHLDLRAMQAGAMDRTGYGATRRGRRLALAGLALPLVLLIVLALLLARWWAMEN